MKQIVIILLTLSAFLVSCKPTIETQESQSEETIEKLIKQNHNLQPGTKFNLEEIGLELTVLNDSSIYARQTQKIKTVHKTKLIPVKIKDKSKTVNKTKIKDQTKTKVKQKDQTKTTVKQKNENDNSQGKTVLNQTKTDWKWILIAILLIAMLYLIIKLKNLK